MPDSFSIRHAQVDDLGKMVDLLRQLFSTEEDFEVDPQKQFSGLKLLLQAENAQIFVAANRAGEVVAMASLQLVVSTAEGGEVGWVEDVVVDLSCRGQGIGKALLRYVAEWAKVRGIKRLQLVADKNNQPALDFYRKQNWLETKLVVFRQK